MQPDKKNVAVFFTLLMTLGFFLSHERYQFKNFENFILSFQGLLQLRFIIYWKIRFDPEKKHSDNWTWGGRSGSSYNSDPSNCLWKNYKYTQLKTWDFPSNFKTSSSKIFTNILDETRWLEHHIKYHKKIIFMYKSILFKLNL